MSLFTRPHYNPALRKKQCFDQAESILDKADTESRELSVEEEAKYDEMIREIKSIHQMEKLSAAAGTTVQPEPDTDIFDERFGSAPSRYVGKTERVPGEMLIIA